MSSSFFGIQIGRTALMSHQVAIDTTGHNIANVNTEGYTRQRVVASQSTNLQMMYGPQGAGVNIDDINRVHEVFLERQVSRVTTQSSYDSQMLSGLDELQTVMNEPGDQSLSAAITEFWNSWESLSIKPTDAGLRAQVVEAASLVATEYNTRIAGFQSAEKGFNEELKGLVTQANELASQIATLNMNIAKAEITGESANDLRDQRDAKVRQISELLGVEPEQDGAFVNLRFPDGGPYLVSGTNSFGLKAQTGADGWISGISLEVHPLEINSGRIGAYLELRDKVSPELRTELSDMMARVTDRVNELHEQGYDLELRPGQKFFNWSGGAERVTTYPSSGIFEVSIGTALTAGTHYLDVVSVDQATPGNLLVGNTYGNLSAGSIQLSHTGGTYAGENALNLDYHVRVLDANTAAGNLGGMRVQLFRGDEAVSTAVSLNAGVSSQTLSWTVDGMTIQADVTAQNPPLPGANALFVKGERSDGLSTTGVVSLDGGVPIAVDHTAATDYNFVNGPLNGYIAGGAAGITFEQLKAFKGSTFTVNSSTGTLSVNPVVAADTDRIAASVPRASGQAPAAGDGEMARMIGALATGLMFEFTGETASGRLGSIVQGLGEQGRQAAAFQEASKSILTQLETQKQSFSGVNVDEEMVLLIQFQRGFEASARFVTASDQLLDTVINRLGRVGL